MATREAEVEIDCDRCGGFVDEVLCEDCRSTVAPEDKDDLLSLAQAVCLEQERITERTTCDVGFLSQAIARLGKFLFEHDKLTKEQVSAICP